MFKVSAEALEAQAGPIAKTLRALGNDKRLAILCKLAAAGEMNGTELAAVVGLSQSALSQHLARLRKEGAVGFRRERQTIWYRLNNPKIEALMTSLQHIYCEKENQ